jgi:hypothetical protein
MYDYNASPSARKKRRDNIPIFFFFRIKFSLKFWLKIFLLNYYPMIKIYLLNAIPNNICGEGGPCLKYNTTRT